jgi:hypothetical protein
MDQHKHSREHDEVAREGKVGLGEDDEVHEQQNIRDGQANKAAGAPEEQGCPIQMELAVQQARAKDAGQAA